MAKTTICLALIPTFLFLISLLHMCCAEHIKATATIFNADKSQVLGRIDLRHDSVANSVKINGTLSNILPTGKHGFHIHEFGNLGNKCLAAGGHFNPKKHNHGAPTDSDRHVGDLGNVESDSSGTVNVVIEDSIIQLSGENSIIGRAIVVHEGEDDLGLGGHEDSKTTGHAGARLGCGVIGIA